MLTVSDVAHDNGRQRGRVEDNLHQSEHCRHADTHMHEQTGGHCAANSLEETASLEESASLEGLPWLPDRRRRF